MAFRMAIVNDLLSSRTLEKKIATDLGNWFVQETIQGVVSRSVVVVALLQEQEGDSHILPRLSTF